MQDVEQAWRLQSNTIHQMLVSNWQLLLPWQLTQPQSYHLCLNWTKERGAVTWLNRYVTVRAGWEEAVLEDTEDLHSHTVQHQQTQTASSSTRKALWCWLEWMSGSKELFMRHLFVVRAVGDTRLFVLSSYLIMMRIFPFNAGFMVGIQSSENKQWDNHNRECVSKAGRKRSHVCQCCVGFRHAVKLLFVSREVNETCLCETITWPRLRSSELPAVPTQRQVNTLLAWADDV